MKKQKCPACWRGNFSISESLPFIFGGSGNIFWVKEIIGVCPIWGPLSIFKKCVSFYYFINVNHVIIRERLYMIHDKSDLIIERAMANVMATVKMLDDHIIQEKDEKRVNELKVKRDILLEVLKDLAEDHNTANSI